MNVLVDTSVWSLSLRRRSPLDHPAVQALHRLIEEARVRLIGPVRQEILSGIRETAQLERLRLHLSFFPDMALETEDYERAAELFNLCRSRGLQGSNTDFLLCSVAKRRNMSLLTTDEDFSSFARYLPFRLFEVAG